MSAPQLEVTEVLRVLEQAAHEDGWDRPAALWSVRVEDGRAYPRCLHRFTQQGSPAALLEYMSINLPREQPDFPRMAREVWEAMAFVVEAWSAPGSESGGEGQPRPSEHPERVEIRMATAVDREGHVWTVMRERGKPAEVRSFDTFDGRIVDSLRRLMGLEVKQ